MQITVSSTHRTYACHNPADALQVTGSSDILTITGSCGSLQVTGNSNTITIDSVDTVQFTGNSNTVLYRSSRRPTVGDNVHSNSVARASRIVTSQDTTVSSSEDAAGAVSGSVAGAVAAAQQAAVGASDAAATAAGAVQGVQSTNTTLNIIFSRRQTTQDCGNGKTVNINGYQNEITLTGSCGKVILNGWSNTIHIEEVAAIEIGGHDNAIFWQRGRNVPRPQLQIDSGMNNSVRHLTPASH